LGRRNIQKGDHDMPRARVLVYCAIAATTHIYQPALGQIPSIINYQGRIVQGTNLPTETIGLSIQLYDAPIGGTLLYEDSNSVTVVDGLYSTMIGDDTIFGSLNSALTNNAVHIQLVVNGIVLEPRERLVSVPYALTAVGVVPPGTVLPYAGITNSVPNGWHLCDGRSLIRDQYPALFASIQTTYGSTNSTTFRLPDMRGRVPMGAGQGSGLSNRTLGQNVGAQSHTLTTAEMPAHNHGGTTSMNGLHSHGHNGYINVANGTGKQPKSRERFTTDPQDYGGEEAGNHSHTISVDGGGGLPLGQAQPHNIIQPSLVLNYIIKD
jgi:microcystin-dependent protein